MLRIIVLHILIFKYQWVHAFQLNANARTAPVPTALEVVKRRNAFDRVLRRAQSYPMDGDDELKVEFEGSFPMQQPGQDVEYLFEIGVPLITPIVAFYTYEPVAHVFSALLDILSSRDWIAVDGGALQARVIAPAINGLVVPATSLLYATLTSTTITTLRQRQVDIRSAINQEAGELRNLCQLVKCFPKGISRNRCRGYLIKYTRRIVSECQPNVEPLKDLDTELNDLLVQVNLSYNDPIPAHLADQSLAAVSKLQQERLARITALQSMYPILHYAALVLLALADCLSFLIETNQDLLFFLNNFELKVLWSILLATFVACFTLFYDLSSPFAGSYQIRATVAQLYAIRRILVLDVFDDDVREKDD